MFRSAPSFTAAAVLTLALGLGVNIAVFTVMHAALLAGLPVRHGRELVNVFSWTPKGGDHFDFSYPLYVDLRDHAEGLQGLAGLYVDGRRRRRRPTDRACHRGDRDVELLPAAGRGRAARSGLRRCRRTERRGAGRHHQSAAVAVDVCRRSRRRRQDAPGQRRRGRRRRRRAGGVHRVHARPARRRVGAGQPVLSARPQPCRSLRQSRDQLDVTGRPHASGRRSRARPGADDRGDARGGPGAGERRDHPHRARARPATRPSWRTSSVRCSS